MDKIFNSIFASETQNAISAELFLLCMAVALVLGACFAFSFSRFNRSSLSFLSALALLPCAVCVVIMTVNGNVGMGVAVAGAFSLVRFRSAQGTAKEICAIFAAMCCGLMLGAGYIAYSAIFTIVMCVALVFVNRFSLNEFEKSKTRVLKITIPEDLDYPSAFNESFALFTEKQTLLGVKTSDMGSLLKLTYEVCLKNGVSEKKFIDNLRLYNGNLEISLSVKPVDGVL